MDSLTEHTQVVCTLVAISGLTIRFRWFVSALQNEDLKTWRPGDLETCSLILALVKNRVRFKAACARPHLFNEDER